MSTNALSADFDTYLFAYHNGVLELIVGDFDALLSSLQDVPALIAHNIEWMLSCFLVASSCFAMGETLFDKFASYLVDLQKKWDKRLDNIDLQQICNKVCKTLTHISAR